MLVEPLRSLINKNEQIRNQNFASSPNFYTRKAEKIYNEGIARFERYCQSRNSSQKWISTIGNHEVHTWWDGEEFNFVTESYFRVSGLHTWKQFTYAQNSEEAFIHHEIAVNTIFNFAVAINLFNKCTTDTDQPMEIRKQFMKAVEEVLKFKENLLTIKV